MNLVLRVKSAYNVTRMSRIKKDQTKSHLNFRFFAFVDPSSKVIMTIALQVLRRSMSILPMNARINLFFRDRSSLVVLIATIPTVKNEIQIRLLEKAGRHIRGFYHCSTTLNVHLSYVRLSYFL